MGLFRSSKCMYCGGKVKNTQYGTCESCGEDWHLQCAKGNGDFRQAHDSGLIKDKDYYRFNCPNCGHVMEKQETHIL